MSNLTSPQQRKEKLLRRLESLSPSARKAILEAALEQKQNQKSQTTQKTPDQKQG